MIADTRTRSTLKGNFIPIRRAFHAGDEERRILVPLLICSPVGALPPGLYLYRLLIDGALHEGRLSVGIP